MPIDIQKYNRLKERLDAARSNAARAEGALESIQKKMLEEYGCSTIEQAEAVLADLKNKRDLAEAEFTDALSQFELKWGPLL